MSLAHAEGPIVCAKVAMYRPLPEGIGDGARGRPAEMSAAAAWATTDLERFSLVGPRIKELRKLFLKGGPDPSPKCEQFLQIEIRGLTQQRMMKL
jgi:hypothetical protein